MTKPKQPPRVWGEWIEDEAGNRVKDFPIHSGQAEALNSTARITAVIAGTGGGKTSFVPLWLMKQIQKNPQGRFIVVSPNFKMLRRTVLKEIQEAFAGLPEFEGRYIEQKWEYHCPTGAMIYLYSADEPQSIQGVHADAAVIDECGLVKAEVFAVIRQRTNKKSGPILLTSTPYGFNWLFYDVYVPAKAGDPNVRAINFKSTENPTYPKEEFEKERKRLPDWRFRMLYLGEFTRPDGVVYPGLRDCVIDKSQLPRVQPDTIVGGMDFGFNDPAAALAGFVYENVLYVVYEKYECGLTVGEFAKGLPRQVLWFCDSSRPDSIKELKKLGFVARPCKKYAGSVADNIDFVNGLIRTGRLKIVKEAVSSLLAEADIYTYQQGEREGQYLDKPVDSNNHACDALAYLTQACKRRRLLTDDGLKRDVAA